MAMKKVPNLSGMRQQHFSKPSPICDYVRIVNEWNKKHKDRERERKRKGKARGTQKINGKNERGGREGKRSRRRGEQFNTKNKLKLLPA